MSGGQRWAMIAYLVVIRHERSNPLIGTKDLQEDDRQEHDNWLAVGYLLSLTRPTQMYLSTHECCRYTGSGTTLAVFDTSL